jgi:hypothetical protein
MPRDGSGVYTKPYPSVVSGTTIESLVYNGQVDDVTADLNTARPIVSGGTGANNAAGGLFNLGGEKATQVVTSYDSHIWIPGSFRSAVGATGAPNATAIFSGVCYIHEALANPPTNQNVTVEARDVSDGVLYIRTKTAGTWSAWKTERQSIYAAPFDALAYNGMQINGSMEVSQEKGYATATTANGGFICDGWRLTIAGAAAVAVTPASAVLVYGFTNQISLSVTTAAASIAAGDIVAVINFIEGYRIARLAWGTASAQPITIGFWTQHHRTGVYSGTVSNGAANRSYGFTYTQASADVAQYNTVTIPGDTSGVWLADSGIGIRLSFAIASGSTYTATAGAWGAFGYGATGQINGVAATSDVFRLTGVVVLPGTQAPSAAQSPLIMRPFDQELLICKRYFRRINYGVGVAYSATQIRFPVDHADMRATPTASVNGAMTVGDVIAVNSTQSAAAVTINANNPNYGWYDFPNFSGLTSGRVHLISATSSLLQLDARL